MRIDHKRGEEKNFECKMFTVFVGAAESHQVYLLETADI